MQAANASDPLLRDFVPHITDAEDLWRYAQALSGARAQALVNDYPVATALVEQRLQATLGSDGLTLKSLYQRDDDPDTDEGEEAKRREIEKTIGDCDEWIDASHTMSRLEVEEQIRYSAIVLGDGFAIRVLQDDRPGSPIEHAWRQIHPSLVVNPRMPSNRYAIQYGEIDLPGGRRIVDGIELDKHSRPLALHYASTTRVGMIHMPGDTVRVPWYAPDGTPNVLHARGLCRQGSIRGLTEFAPMILSGQLLRTLGVSYVASKRVHASHPLLIKVDDIAAAKSAYAGTAFANLLIGRDHDVTMNDMEFKGEDYAAFYDVELRNLCSAWGMPYELVVGDHSAKSGAASRSMWQQFYERASKWQTAHIRSVTRRIDECILRERVARGLLSLSSDWQRNLSGRYKRPSRVMPDPLKEAQAAELWHQLGVSKTTLFADAGRDFADETMQRHQDARLEQAQEVEPEPEPTPEVDDQQQEETPDAE
jgi:capsid protein